MFLIFMFIFNIFEDNIQMYSQSCLFVIATYNNIVIKLSRYNVFVLS